MSKNVKHFEGSRYSVVVALKTICTDHQTHNTKRPNSPVNGSQRRWRKAQDGIITKLDLVGLDLTRECLIDIFSRLSVDQRWIGPMLVCKTWMNVCHDPLFNTIFDLETRFQSFPESINWWNPEFEDKVDSFLRSVVDRSEGCLTEIRVRHCTDRSLSYAAERCPKLEVLWIKSCPNVTDASMTKIASNCPNLKELDMSYSYGISHESLVMLGKNCHNLKILKRNIYPRLDPNMPTIVAPLDYLATYPKHANVEAEVIGRHMPQLKQLEFRYTTLTAKGLALVCEGCLDLEYMDLYGCISLRSEEITRCTSSLMSLREINKPNFMFPMAILRMSKPDHPRYG